MSERGTRVDDLLRRFAGNPEPGPDDRARARSRLETTIEARQKGWWVGRRLAIVGIAAVITLVATLVVLQVERPTQASATMEEIAHALETVSPLSVDETEFVYWVTESVGLVAMDTDLLGEDYPNDHFLYLEPRSRETWRGAGGSIQMRETVGVPTFFSPEEEETFYEAGIDAMDGVGETTTETFSGLQNEEWPADSEELDAAIRDDMTTGRGLTETMEYLDVALDILRDTIQPPDVRASTLLLIGELKGLEHVESTSDGSTFRIEYVDRTVETRLTFTVSHDGYLLFEETLNLTADETYGIPAGTAIYTAEYTAPVVVDSLDEPAP
jgi:hypothetical protein